MCGAWVLLWLLAIPGWVTSSEFPERECCDLPSPQPTVPATSTTFATTGRPGLNTKSTTEIQNCLLARQYCFEDSSCAAILEIIPRVCGPELIACSTVTVTKCQAALRTLQAFQFFRPTCLCKEPRMDPECNSFRDFLFDHPCVYVIKKEKDPYPVDALLTCNYALSVCQQEPKCIKLYDDFKLNCKVRDNKCRMDDRNLCFEAWTNLRMSPMFGCICPNNHMKKRCDRIFHMVNHNPCVDTDTIIGTSTDIGTNTNIDSTAYESHLVEESLITSLQSSQLVEADIEASDNTSASFDYGLGTAIVENPLVDAVNGWDAPKQYDHFSVSLLKNKEKSSLNFIVNNYPDEAESSSSGLPSYHQKYPSPVNQFDSNEVGKLIFQSTCHLAMDSCNNNYQCRMLLHPILHHCDMSRCNRNSCMEALQTFYGKPDLPWNVEIAFCLCKKTDNKQDACLVAQEKLHPVCAQRIEGAPQPTCLQLAEVCRETHDCRARLENYEQSCAVDSVTKKCAGSPRECRAAILGILGTDLRTTCACKGTDLTQLYECLGWQRLLWVNPCVVESQKNYHMKKAAEQALLTTTHLPTITSTAAAIRTRPTPVQFITVMAATEASLQTRKNTIAEFIPPPQPFVPTISTTTTRITTRTTTRTTTPSTTTLPPRSCVVQRPQFPNQYIKEGSFKRFIDHLKIYHEDEFECSDVCECEIGEKLTCKTICIDRMPCKTEFAYYNHAAPAYQAFRGRCLCYSGRFICMKPLPNDYSLPQGIFLFLGYSEVDERELNKNHTVVVIQDIVRVLQNFIKEEAINGTLCTLEFFNASKENVIIAGKLSEEIDYTKLSPMEILSKEKEECAQLLEKITDKINSRNPEFTSHLLLSIFKMAEVEIVQIEPASSSQRNNISFRLLIMSILILFLQNILASS